MQALVFLNMFTTKNGEEPVFTPYRVLVTVVNTDQGWLVSDLETKYGGCWTSLPGAVVFCQTRTRFSSPADSPRVGKG